MAGQRQHIILYCPAHIKLYMVLQTEQIILSYDELLVCDPSGYGGIKTAEHYSHWFHVVDLILWRDS